jgi:hypothetical protein
MNMSLDVTLYMDIDVGAEEPYRMEFYSANITHNLGKMAEAAGIYQYLWHPEDTNAETAKDLIVPLEEGYKELVENPDYYKVYNAANGWGMYDHFLRFVEDYLEACKKFPKARIEVSR